MDPAPPRSHRLHRQLPELPNEILFMIIQNCSRPTLKNVRLASKSLAEMSTPKLWRKIVLVPNAECVVPFANTLQGSKAALHVRKVVYDARWAGLYYYITSRPEQRAHLFDEEKVRADDVLNRTMQGRFQSYDEMSLEVAMLTKALVCLPNLRQVEIRESDDTAPPRAASMPRFYQKLCRAVNIDLGKVDISITRGISDRSHTKGFLLAAFSAGMRLESLKASALDGRTLLGDGPVRTSVGHQQFSLYRMAMAHLQVLHLAFKNNTLSATAMHLRSVLSLLKSAKNVKELKLRLTDCSVTRYEYQEDDLLSDLSPLLETETGGWTTQPILPHLESLSIKACICHDEDLMHFLKIHSASLRTLELSNISLLGSSDHRECWVRLIKRLQTELKLKSMLFSGWFSNGGRQQWFVAKDTAGPGRLKSRVQKFVVDQSIRECPLETAAIEPTQGDVARPANGQEYHGDLTWAMVYAVNEHGGFGDLQPTAPVFVSLGEASDSVTQKKPPPNWAAVAAAAKLSLETWPSPNAANKEKQSSSSSNWYHPSETASHKESSNHLIFDFNPPENSHVLESFDFDSFLNNHGPVDPPLAFGQTGTAQNLQW